MVLSRWVPTKCNILRPNAAIKVEDTIPASDTFPQSIETPILSILNTQN
jgi:hypothetical protein